MEKLFDFLAKEIIDNKEGLDATILPSSVNTYKSKTCNFVFEKDEKWIIAKVSSKTTKDKIKVVIYPINDAREPKIEVLNQDSSDIFKDIALSSLKCFLHEKLMEVVSKHFDLGFTDDDLKELEV